MAETDKDKQSGRLAPRGPAPAAKRASPGGKGEGPDAREARLAEALRANLRRRKANRKEQA